MPAEWVHGNPVAGFKKGHVYLVEFWATWCSPCISSAPHIAELQRKYGDREFTVVGITQLDRWGGTRDSILAMIGKMGAKMDYPIAIDSVAPKAYQGVFNGKTECAYLGKAQVQAIPCTFLIDQNGRIAYIGLPTLVDATLDRLISRRFDLAAASKSYLKTKRTERNLTEFFDLTKAKKYDRAYAVGWRCYRGGADIRTLWLIAAGITDLGPNGPSKRDLKLAKLCAEKAIKNGGQRDAGMLATLASVHYLLHHPSETNRLMKSAIALAEGEQKEALLKQAKQFGCPGE